MLFLFIVKSLGRCTTKDRCKISCLFGGVGPPLFMLNLLYCAQVLLHKCCAVCWRKCGAAPDQSCWVQCSAAARFSFTGIADEIGKALMVNMCPGIMGVHIMLKKKRWLKYTNNKRAEKGHWPGSVISIQTNGQDSLYFLKYVSSTHNVLLGYVSKKLYCMCKIEPMAYSPSTPHRL